MLKLKHQFFKVIVKLRGHIMEIAKSYITDEEGSIKSVVIDFKTFKRLENILLDQGLAKAMNEVESDNEHSIDDAKLLVKE